MEMGKAEGMWTFPLYREWLQQKTTFSNPRLASAEEIRTQHSLPPGLQKRKAPLASQAKNTEGIIDLDGFDEDPHSILARYKKKT